MILITGATGLIGAHLALELAKEGLLFSALRRENESINAPQALFKMHGLENLLQNINWIEADITDIPSLELAFEGCEYLYHCEEKFSLNPADEKEIRKINIEGTANVVNVALSKQIKKICFLSATEALGSLPEIINPEENTKHQPIDEHNEWNAELYNSDYAISKYGAEMEIWRGQQEGLKIVIVNPGVIISPDVQEWHPTEKYFYLLSKLSRTKNKFPPGGTGFVGVTDVAQSMIRLMNSTVSGSRYILVAENLTFHAFLQLIAKAKKSASPTIPLHNWIAELTYRWNWLKSTVFWRKNSFSKADKTWLFEEKKYNNTKIKEKLHFEFAPITTVIEER